MPPSRPSALRAALATGALLGWAALPGPLGPVAFVAFLPFLRVLARRDAGGARGGGGLSRGPRLLRHRLRLGAERHLGGGLAAAYLLALPLLAAVFGALRPARRRDRPPLAGASPSPQRPVSGSRSSTRARRSGCSSVPWGHLGYAPRRLALPRPGRERRRALRPLVLDRRRERRLAARLPAVLAGGTAPRSAVPASRPSLPRSRCGASRRRRAEAGPARRRPCSPRSPRRSATTRARFHANLRGSSRSAERALAEQPADLVVWPESAYERPAGRVGRRVPRRDRPRPRDAARHRRVAHARCRGSVPGATRRVLAAEDGTTWVAEKVHPVPVYERAPDGLLDARRSRTLVSGRDASSRGEPQRAGAAAAPGAEATPCPSASSSASTRAIRSSRGASARTGRGSSSSIANEAGTGPWSAALHARAARLRAIENRVPVVRVANTGSHALDRRLRPRASRSCRAPLRAAGTRGAARSRARLPVRLPRRRAARRQRRRDGPRRRRPRSRAAAASRRASRSRTLSPERSLVMKSRPRVLDLCALRLRCPLGPRDRRRRGRPAVGASGGGSSYYEQAARQPEALTGAKAGAAGLPAALHVVEAAGGVAYRVAGRRRWEVERRGRGATPRARRRRLRSRAGAPAARRRQLRELAHRRARGKPPRLRRRSSTGARR